MPLTRHHCRALAWWLKAKYIPFATNRWKATRTVDDARHLYTGTRLAKFFARSGERSLKNLEQDREAARIISRDDACWLGAQISASMTGKAPFILARFTDGQFPSAEALAQLPSTLARELLLGLGAYEAMHRCYERAYSRKVGKKRSLLTLGEVTNRYVGDPRNGGDERYERRLRQRAREDETAAAIAQEFGLSMRALEARSHDKSKFP